MPQALLVDIDELKRWVGREERVTDVLSSDLVRKFRATFDLPPGDVSEGTNAPRLIHYCLGQPAVGTSALGADGHPPKGGFLPPVPLRRRMWAASALTFNGELHVEDRVVRHSRIKNVVAKSGAQGPLVFVTIEHEIEVDGRQRITEVQDIVYRSGEKATSTKTLPQAPHGMNLLGIAVSPTLLFRYSALTFNGHRIHYDRRYAQTVEHYAGLVIHGPLLATLLMNFAIALRGSAPRSFSFRGVSPLVDEDAITLFADGTGDALELWAARDAGPVGMKAEARWQ